MKKLKNQTKILYVGLILAFIMIWQKMTAKTTIVNNTVASVPQTITPYKAKYFSDNEYFASMPIPTLYYNNWVTLVKY
jgi:hypothetical protein